MISSGLSPVRFFILSNIMSAINAYHLFRPDKSIILSLK